MLTEQIQALEALGFTVVKNRYVVVEHEDETFSGLDEAGEPAENRDAEGNLRDVTVCVGAGKKKVYHDVSKDAVKTKIKDKLPDLTVEKDKS